MCLSLPEKKIRCEASSMSKFFDTLVAGYRIEGTKFGVSRESIRAFCLRSPPSSTEPWRCNFSHDHGRVALSQLGHSLPTPAPATCALQS